MRNARMLFIRDAWRNSGNVWRKLVGGSIQVNNYLLFYLLS